MPRLTIQMKLLIVFMLLFTVFLGGAFYWFYQFSTNRMMDELRNSLVVSASTAANMVNAEEHTNVYENGKEDDARYTHIADQLRLVRDANPRAAAVYTAVRSPNPNEVVFVVSAEENPEDRAHLRDPYDASNAPEMMKAFDRPIADVEMGADEYGVWLSGYAPIRDVNGKSVGIVGVDMYADDVIRLQRQIRNVSILVFIISYAVVFLAVFILSDTFTRPIEQITAAAKKLEHDEPFDAKQLAPLVGRSDELGLLARVFGEMAEQVQAREQKLKQEVVQLRIEIDQSKREKQVSEIVDSEFFQDLKDKAGTMRRRRPSGDASGDKSK